MERDIKKNKGEIEKKTNSAQVHKNYRKGVQLDAYFVNQLKKIAADEETTIKSLIEGLITELIKEKTIQN